MVTISKLKCDLSLHYASIMVQNDISTGIVNIGDTILIRNRLISYATDFVESLNDGTMSENVLNDLLQQFI